MFVDEQLLYEFEKHLNPQNLKDSPIAATLIGYGEISAIFEIDGNRGVAFKRLPLFADHSAATAYMQKYHEYSRWLTAAGLSLPTHQTAVIAVPGRPVSLYIAQEKLPADGFGHQLIHASTADELTLLIETVVAEILKIRSFNDSHRPALELAIDGQLSNWVRPDGQRHTALYYIDTSTPFFRINGVEQLDPELFLKSAPFFLRWILRLFFLQDVINRYYDQRQVFIDLAANLYKEQRPDLVPLVIDVINRHQTSGQAPLTVDEVQKYYRGDRLIWRLFLFFRRIDR
jgi:hypothetical protein